MRQRHFNISLPGSVDDTMSSLPAASLLLLLLLPTRRWRPVHSLTLTPHTMTSSSRRVIVRNHAPALSSDLHREGYHDRAGRRRRLRAPLSLAGASSDSPAQVDAATVASPPSESAQEEEGAYRFLESIAFFVPRCSGRGFVKPQGRAHKRAQVAHRRKGERQ